MHEQLNSLCNITKLKRIPLKINGEVAIIPQILILISHDPLGFSEAKHMDSWDRHAKLTKVWKPLRQTETYAYEKTFVHQTRFFKIIRQIGWDLRWMEISVMNSSIIMYDVGNVQHEQQVQQNNVTMLFLMSWWRLYPTFTFSRICNASWHDINL